MEDVTRNVYLLKSESGFYYSGSPYVNVKNIKKAEIYKTLTAAKAKITTMKKWFNQSKYSIVVLECKVVEIINY
jgi:hypothetical protein